MLKYLKFNIPFRFTGKSSISAFVGGHLDDDIVHGHQLVLALAHGGHQGDAHCKVVLIAANMLNYI